MNKFSDIQKKDIVRIYQFGSSVEGSVKPRDIDIFIIVKDDCYRFRKSGSLYVPFVFREGIYHYFVMPERDGEDLLNAMLYTGRKDPGRQHQGRALQIKTIDAIL